MEWETQWKQGLQQQQRRLEKQAEDNAAVNSSAAVGGQAAVASGPEAELEELLGLQPDGARQSGAAARPVPAPAASASAISWAVTERIDVSNFREMVRPTARTASPDSSDRSIR
jgi:hypothetical protein